MAGSAALELTLGIGKGYEVVGDLVLARREGEGRKERERKKTVGFDGGRHGSECAVVSEEEGGEEAADSNGREGNEQTTGKKSAASKAAPPRLNFGIYRTKIVV